MLRNLMIALAALALLAAPAMAQTATSTSGSAANAVAKSQARANATLDATIGVTSNNSFNGGGNPNQPGAIAWGSASLAGLAGGEGCVLSKTKSINASLGLAMVSVGAGYADGETVPYDICNAFKSLAALQAINPNSVICKTANPNTSCHTAGEITGRIYAHLPAVPEALDELDGKQPTAQQTYVQPAPAPAPVAEAPICPDLPQVTHNACMNKANNGG